MGLDPRSNRRRKRAVARCVPFGRKPKLTEHQAAEAIARRNAGDLSYRTFWRRSHTKRLPTRRRRVVTFRPTTRRSRWHSITTVSECRCTPEIDRHLWIWSAVGYSRARAGMSGCCAILGTSRNGPLSVHRPPSASSFAAQEMINQVIEATWQGTLIGVNRHMKWRCGMTGGRSATYLCICW